MTDLKQNISTFWGEKITLQTKKYLVTYLVANIFLVLLLQVFFMGMLFFIPASAQISPLSPLPESESQFVNPDKILNLVNNVRTKYNLPILKINNDLQTAANSKANYLMTEQIFSHSGLVGEPFSSWVKYTGYDYLRVGENLAIFFTKEEKIVAAWLASETHRQNILNPYYTETGLASIAGIYHNQDAQIVVQIFGQPKYQD